MQRTAVVILTFNSKKYLEQFLPSLIAHTSDAEIWVADNNSSDDTIDFLTKHFSQSIKLLRLKQNTGFAGGYNKALKDIKADNFVLLNADVEVSKGWLEPLIQKLSEKNVGAVQPKIRSFHEKDKFEYAGASGGFLDFLGYPFCRGRVFDNCEKDLGQYDDSIEVFWATGACLAIRKEVFFNAGGFDDRFFAHMEEIDLCWRLKRIGLQNWVEPQAIVYHVGGGTLPKSNPRKTFLNFRNGLLLMFKNLPAAKLIPTLFARLILDGIAAFKFLFSGSVKDFWAIIRAHFSFYQMIPYALRKRRQFVETKSVALFPKSIVWEAFVSHKTTYKQVIND